MEYIIDDSEDKFVFEKPKKDESKNQKSDSLIKRFKKFAGFDPNQKRNKDGTWGNENGSGAITESKINKIEEENKSTLPKVRTNKVFKNEVETIPYAELRDLNVLIDENRINELPIENVSIKDIVPTQRNINIDNLKRVGNSPLDQEDTAILFKRGSKYHVIDGHHRIAREILNGTSKIKIRVYQK